MYMVADIFSSKENQLLIEILVHNNLSDNMILYTGCRTIERWTVERRTVGR